MPECFFCGNPIDPLAKVGMRDECPRCHRDLHICKNCRHYDPSAHNQCREHIAEYIPDREKANFCTFYTFRDGRMDDPSKDIAKSKAKLDALFKKKPSG